MDQERFDRFTKAMATGHSRRSILRGMGASIATAMAGLGLGNASANHGGVHSGGPKPGRCGEAGQPCKFGTHCCSGTCLNGYCACPLGEELVDGVCTPIDLCADVICDDSNECTLDICVDGDCVNAPVTDGRSCVTASGASGTCDLEGICQPEDPCGGTCVHDPSNPCIESATCIDQGCVFVYVSGPCGTDGVCIDGECVEF